MAARITGLLLIVLLAVAGLALSLSLAGADFTSTVYSAPAATNTARPSPGETPAAPMVKDFLPVVLQLLDTPQAPETTPTQGPTDTPKPAPDETPGAPTTPRTPEATSDPEVTPTQGPTDTPISPGG